MAGGGGLSAAKQTAVFGHHLPFFRYHQAMDDIVKQAMAKWPNVPQCYGWLALDARGAWRMRNEPAQAAGLPGERIGNAALLAFINRNYTHDEHGRWYFQNGPQRVYVNLAATPYIARTDPQAGFVLHTGAALDEVDAVWMTEAGALILQGGEVVAQVDDRDMAQCLALLQIDGMPADDEALLRWLDAAEETFALQIRIGASIWPVKRLARDAAARQFGYVPAPQPDAAPTDGARPSVP